MYQKDFPSSIFPYEKQSTINEREELLKLNETSSIYEYAENISKLHYGYPQSITLKDGCGEPECLTQMFYSSDHLHQITSLLPWNSPNHISKGYDLYYDLNLKREADTNDIIEYYHADCKSSLAKFYPNLFLKGSKGKCLYTIEGVWMTPIEFQLFSGSTGADWRSAIQLRTINQPKAKSKTTRPTTIKSLVDNGSLKVHSACCKCLKCQENFIMQPQNIDLLSSFFMNSGNQLVLVHPNKKDLGSLDINIQQTNLDQEPDQDCISDIILPISRSNLKKNLNKNRMIIENSKDEKLVIKQIDCQIFDECSDYFNSDVVAESVTDAFITVNYSNVKFKTFMLELDQTEQLYNIKLLHEFKTKYDHISCVSASHLIQGETAVVLDNSGDIYLANEENYHSHNEFIDDGNNLRIASGLQPLWTDLVDPESNWKSIKYGSQPRLFIYSDHTQVASIDSRIKTNLNSARRIFSINKNNAIGSDIIQRNQLCENDFYTHLICTTKNIILVDERFPIRPLLKWNHHLKAPCTFLKNVSIPCTGGQYTHLALYSDSSEMYAHQFSMKHNMYLSHNFTKKLDTSKDLMSYLPDDYDKRLDKHLEFRLDMPIIGMSTLKYKNSFALFQLKQNCDIFYECYKIKENDSEEKFINKPKNYKKWLESIKKEVSGENDENLNLKFNVMTLANDSKDPVFNLDNFLPEASKHCRICNEVQLMAASFEKKFYQDKNCPRCNLPLNFSNQIMNENSIDQMKSEEIRIEDFLEEFIDINSIVLENEFTKDLYTVWLKQEEEDEKMSVEDGYHKGDKSKRRKI